ncbi:MAG: ATP-binding cassette domain-containing protein [Bacillus subtilis]|nr:ATP-binding cassette domain-containing protein [Bacillus subtilis]
MRRRLWRFGSEQVSYAYPGYGLGNYDAIKDITLDIAAKGEFIALVGQTGSGKSTLAQHMNALIFPTAGTVEIFGHIVGPKRDRTIKYNELRRKVGLVFQFPEYQLFEETVEKDIMFGPMNFGVPEEEARTMAWKALGLVGLGPTYLKRNPLNLSGGEKKRVSIAGILAMDPAILVLDEPTSGLDPRGKQTMMDLFQSIREETAEDDRRDHPRHGPRLRLHGPRARPRQGDARLRRHPRRTVQETPSRNAPSRLSSDDPRFVRGGEGPRDQGRRLPKGRRNRGIRPPKGGAAMKNIVIGQYVPEKDSSTASIRAPRSSPSSS